MRAGAVLAQRTSPRAENDLRLSCCPRIFLQKSAARVCSHHARRHACRPSAVCPDWYRMRCCHVVHLRPRPDAPRQCNGCWLAPPSAQRSGHAPTRWILKLQSFNAELVDIWRSPRFQARTNLNRPADMTRGLAKQQAKDKRAKKDAKASVSIDGIAAREAQLKYTCGVCKVRQSIYSTPIAQH